MDTGKVVEDKVIELGKVSEETKGTPGGTMESADQPFTGLSVG